MTRAGILRPCKVLRLAFPESIFSSIPIASDVAFTSSGNELTSRNMTVNLPGRACVPHGRAKIISDGNIRNLEWESGFNCNPEHHICA